MARPGAAAGPERRSLPAILMTAYLYGDEQLDEDRRRGITLLRKPFDADEILRLFAAGLGNGPASKP